mmetsp:Transcript_3077/g.8434  ORF Transcript_3077/g.8434 Transcript_3077/m.8434 type:complete len:186 (-) Transcript_3077:400-957(-)
MRLHLPATEADNKAHTLLHLACNVLSDFGPLFAVSMFGPESLWGHLVRLAHNKRCPEATVLNAASDWLAVQQVCALPGLVGSLAEDLRSDVLEVEWSTEARVADDGIAASAEGCHPHGKAQWLSLACAYLCCLFDFCQSRVPWFKQAWQEYLQELSQRSENGCMGTELRQRRGCAGACSSGLQVG